jgi:multiple sugar transport system ATP-binding protein
MGDHRQVGGEGLVEVRLEDIVKTFGRVRALDDINLEVRDGESMVLLGPSGCGKTTTLRIIAGLEKPDRGRVLFGERDVTLLPPRSRNISMVFQSYAVWPHMSVFDNIAFPLRIKKYQESEIRRRVKWAAELLRIEDLLDRYPHQLSGGQRQRVAVARAIVVEPDVLLMDEPLSNLDALLRVKMRSEIKKLQRTVGVTMIYVTHDQTEAMVIADRIAVMDKGKVLQVGTPEDVYNRPVDTFVATFIGSPQMNLVKSMVHVTPSGPYLQIGGSKVRLDRPELYKHDGREVLVGIRPEHVRLDTEGEGVQGTIDFIENLGSDIIVHVKIGEEVIVAKVKEEPPPVGSKVVAILDESRIRVFDASTGKLVS